MQPASSPDRAGRRRSPSHARNLSRGVRALQQRAALPACSSDGRRAAGDDGVGVRLRAVIIVLWRAGLRISEALAIAETDLDPFAARSSCAKAREGSAARSGWTAGQWEQLEPWIVLRKTLPVGAFFCILHGSTRGRRCSPAGIRAQLHRTAATAGVAGGFPSPSEEWSCARIPVGLRWHIDDRHPERCDP